MENSKAIYINGEENIYISYQRTSNFFKAEIVNLNDIVYQVLTILPCCKSNQNYVWQIFHLDLVIATQFNFHQLVLFFFW